MQKIICSLDSFCHAERDLHKSDGTRDSSMYEYPIRYGPMKREEKMGAKGRHLVGSTAHGRNSDNSLFLFLK